MGWRSTGAAFKAGNYNGPLTSDAGGFASGFAQTFSAGLNSAVNVFVDGMKADEEHERAKELITLRETLQNQRSGATTSTTETRKQAEQLQEAQAFATLHSVSLEEAVSRLTATDWDSSQAGDRITEERATGVLVDTGNGFIPDSPPAASVEVPEAPSASSMDLSFGEPVDDNLEATEPAVQVSTRTTPEALDAEPVRLASRGDTVTDVPVTWVSAADLDVETPIEDRAAAVVDDFGLKVADAGGMAAPEVTLSYPDRIAAGDTPAEAAAVAVRAATMIPEAFKLPTIDDINSLDEAKAALAILDSRRAFNGGRDTYDQNVRPTLERMIASFTELPNLGEMAQENQRDKLQEYVTSGYKAYEGVVPAEDLAAHVARAKELLSSAASMPEIPASLDDLRSMDARVKAGEFGDVPQEWQAQLNVSLRDAEYRDRYGDRLTVDYIFDDARTVRELTGMLESATTALGEDSPVVRDLQTAIRLRDEMPDAPDLPKISDVRAANYEALAAAALEAGDEDLAAFITALGAEMKTADPETAATLSEVSGIIARSPAVEPAQEAITNFVNAADSGYELTKIVAENPNILTFFGGQAPSFVSRINSELSSLTELFVETGSAATYADINRTFESYERGIQQKLANKEISEQAAAYAMYRSQEARFAYLLVRSQQGGAGVVSNQDYNSTVAQIRTSVQSGTFEESLRQLLARDQIKVSSAIDAARNDGQVRIAQKILTMNEIEFDPLGGLFRPLNEVAEARGAGEAYRWVTGEITLADTVTPQPTTPAPQTETGPGITRAGQTGVEPVAIPQSAIDYLIQNIEENPDLKDAFDAKYGAGKADTYLGGQ